jgi:hypothetical protein
VQIVFSLTRKIFCKSFQIALPRSISSETKSRVDRALLAVLAALLLNADGKLSG